MHVLIVIGQEETEVEKLRGQLEFKHVVCNYDESGVPFRSHFVATYMYMYQTSNWSNVL